MDTSKDVFIVLEGTDGSDEGVQYTLLANRLIRAGYDVAAFNFPQYGQPSSYFVKQYLNGAYNNGGAPGPYTASLFYALDRYEAAPAIRRALQDGKIVLAQGFAGSNMAHQGAKIDRPEERRGYFIWNDHLEFEMLHIPRPTMSYILRVPAEAARIAKDQASSPENTNKTQDSYKNQLAHTKKSVSVYDDLAQLFPRDFTRIDCARNNIVLPADVIHDILWQKIQPLLPEPAKGRKGHLERLSTLTPAATPPTPNEKPIQASPEPEPVVRKDEHGYAITETGKRFLETHVTSSVGNVYALNGKLGPEATAALIARFTQKAGDLRSTLLLEFAAATAADAKLQGEALNSYQNEAKYRLTNAHVVLGAVSGVLTKTIAQTGHEVLVEQSQTITPHTIKDANGNYGYYTPKTLSPDTQLAYHRSINKLFDAYNDLVGALETHLAETSSAAPRNTAVTLASAVLPLATYTTVVLYGSSAALEHHITSLMGSDLPEARSTGQRMLAEVRKVLPHLHAGTDKSDRGGAQIVYNAHVRSSMQQLAHKQLPENHAAQPAPLRLVRLWPRNELDLLPDILYPYSNRPLHDITAEIAQWTYDTKATALEAYVGKRRHGTVQPGQALETATYTWDLVTDYTVFRELCQLMGSAQAQASTPRYGYEVPSIVENAGVSDQFEACFDLSLELHSLLQQAGFTAEAEYATLRGHKLRWQLTHTARDILSIDTRSIQLNQNTSALLAQMREKLSEVHPILGESANPPSA